MTRYLLDTNHASALYKQLPQLTARINGSADAFYLCEPSVGELWFMVYNSTRVVENTARLETFLQSLQHLGYSGDSASAFGDIKAALRKLGRMIPDVDIQIAAIARTNDMTLLTDDAHFAWVHGIRRANWLR